MTDFASPDCRRPKLMDETLAVERVMAQVRFDSAATARIERRARDFVAGVRKARRKFGGLDDFLEEYELTTPEGIALMCLAEALLRIPDADTADRLIADKVGSADWESHIGASESWFVNASTWALMLTGKVVDEEHAAGNLPSFGQLVAKLGEPVIRAAVSRAMRVLGAQFVMGRTIDEALNRARADVKAGYTHSFDMLGEGARSADDAVKYFESYMGAIARIGAAAQGLGPHAGPGISVKLSALFPRYEYAQRARAVPTLVARLSELAHACRAQDIGLTVDAEEADRLDLSLDIIEQVFRDTALDGWTGFGLAVQAYQKRALDVVDWITALAGDVRRPISVRLVKGAYWDSEIKWAQVRGLPGYPVFTRKVSTDVSYLACAARLFAAGELIYPMMATHNAHTVAAVFELSAGRGDFEFQRLHGMGEPLYHQIVGADAAEDVRCRIYAPVGSHEDLLPYLVRRLLENGANTSFVNRLRDDAAPLDDVVADPVAKIRDLEPVAHPKIPCPVDLYRPDRKNSLGIDLTDAAAVDNLYRDMAAALETGHTATPLIGGAAPRTTDTRPVLDPADTTRHVGTVAEATGDMVDAACRTAEVGFAAWDRTPVEDRAAILERAAELFEERRAELMALAIREAGKTIPDALAEVREAADFCRYYAARARGPFGDGEVLTGPTGESNTLSLRGRGVFACISPWNFPLAIFTGQVAAALAAGNAVVAKPAEQTPLIAMRAVELMHEAGIPADALNLLPGSGEEVGAPLVSHEAVAGVAFTGSTDTARAINRALAARNGPIVPLIAETGGQNAMIVDASALPEQVVDDVIASGFQSAGQRCSALRVLFIQQDVADRVLDLLCGAAEELVLGDPWNLETDVGPVIDEEARATLVAHAESIADTGRLLFDLPVPKGLETGTFFSPKLAEIDGIGRLEREVFGPIVHVVRYSANRLEAVVDAINATGYGLTVGVHSRIDSTQRYVLENVHAGNAYVNRSMIGAVVGVQPFGGEGLSGTGPKAGGPHYLPRFAVERARSINTAAAGGNAALMTMDE